MSTYLDEFHNLVTMLEEEGHHLADRFRAAWHAVAVDFDELRQHAVDDAQQVAIDATPVVREAVQDMQELGAEISQDITKGIDGPSAA